MQVPESNTEATEQYQMPEVLFPGAFNPIHSAHRRMAKFAAERLGQPVTFELSITNVDKPPLDYLEIADRLAQFTGERVLLTRAPRFVEKARLAPGCTFVVGTDTIVRIGESRYYPAAKPSVMLQLRIDAGGCRFLVFGRRVDRGSARCRVLEYSAALREICDEVPESEFREDILIHGATKHVARWLHDCRGFRTSFILRRTTLGAACPDCLVIILDYGVRGNELGRHAS